MRTRHWTTLFVAFLAALAACTGGGARRSDPRPHLAQEEASPLRMPQLRPATGELAALSREMAGAAENVRELRFKQPITVVEGTPEVVSWLLRREVEQLRASGELESEQATLEAFGFIPHEGDYEALILDLYEEQVRGLYDHKEKILLVVPTLPEKIAGDDISAGETAELAKATARLEASLFLLHEIVHALQDQHFGLERFLEDVKTMDQGLAGRALVEGDATFAMYEYFLGGFGRSLSDLPDLGQIVALFGQAVSGPEHDRLQEAPLYVRETLMFSYLSGLVFVHALHGLGGWEAVNAAYDNPPSTTQQVLHFEHYLAGLGGEILLLPELPELDEAGYLPAAGGSMGELGLRLFLAEHSGDAPGPGVACGWKGDAYAVYTREGSAPVAAWVVSFSDEAAATAFLQETENSFPLTSSVAFGRIGADLIGMTTHLSQEQSNIVFQSLANVRREPAPVVPFSPPASLSEATSEDRPEATEGPKR